MPLSTLDIIVILAPLIFVVAVNTFLQRYVRCAADYLVASRCAGRYVLCTANAEMGAGFSGTLAALEAFSKTGHSLGPWQSFNSIVMLLVAMFAFVGYRFRQTRSLTFHQFLETRYSRRFRMFSATLNFISGIINFGFAPGVISRFMVYFCGFPPNVTIWSHEVPTFALFMAVLMAFNVYFVLGGGQISMMVTDCLEGLISGVLYLVIAVACLFLFSWHQVSETLCSGAPGLSLINPFDIGKRPDFDLWYVAFGILTYLYTSQIGGGSAGGFAASALSPHESKMAGILGWWRGFGSGAMAAVVSVGALTVLHHPDFADKAKAINDILATITNTSTRSQAAMPLAIRMILPAGIAGCYVAIGMLGVFAGESNQMLRFGSTFIQDVLLPLRGRPYSPKMHVFVLRMSAVAVALFAYVWSLTQSPTDYLVMFGLLIGSIYLGGAGVVVIGGLYWKRGTTPAAWTAMALGAVLATAGWLSQKFWVTGPWSTEAAPTTGLCTWLLGAFPSGGFHDYLLQHTDKFFLNGQYISLITFGSCVLSYVVVSLLTCRRSFDMDRLLHRGQYAVQEGGAAPVAKKAWSMERLIGIDEHFTRRDKFIASFIFFWNLGMFAISAGALIWAGLIWRWPDSWWANLVGVRGILVSIVMAFITTVWFTWGGVRDLLKLFKRLKASEADYEDDGISKF